MFFSGAFSSFPSPKEVKFHDFLRPFSFSSPKEVKFHDFRHLFFILKSRSGEVP